MTPRVIVFCQVVGCGGHRDLKLAGTMEWRRAQREHGGGSEAFGAAGRSVRCCDSDLAQPCSPSRCVYAGDVRQSCDMMPAKPMQAMPPPHRGEEPDVGWRGRPRAGHRGKGGLSRRAYNFAAVALVTLGLGYGLFSGVAHAAVVPTAKGAVGDVPEECGEAGGQKAFCSRCENTTALFQDKTADPSWITFRQIFNDPNKPKDVAPTDGQPVNFVRNQAFGSNQYHYFEFKVQGGDNIVADDIRRDAVYLSLVSPDTIKVSRGEVVVVSEDSAKKPAYDFYVGQNCVPQEGAWNNQVRRYIGTTKP